MECVTPDLPRLLGPSEVGELLGLSVRTLRRLVKAGQFPPPVRIGGGRLPRWTKAAVAEYVTGLGSKGSH